MTDTKEQTTKPAHYQIKHVANDWILVKRETRRHNWGFVARESNPSKLFSQIPGTAGIGKETIFNITIEGL